MQSFKSVCACLYEGWEGEEGGGREGERERMCIGMYTRPNYPRITND